MLLFFDTEFTELSIDPKLISIGLISEDGCEFYAELSDTWEKSDASDFVLDAVVPFLEGGTTRMTWHELALRLGNWIEGFETPVTLATDSLSWDWPWIPALFAISGTWPPNLARQPEILKQTEEFQLATEAAFASGLRQHHALDDARANRLAWQAVQSGQR